MRMSERASQRQKPHDNPRLDCGLVSLIEWEDPDQSERASQREKPHDNPRLDCGLCSVIEWEDPDLLGKYLIVLDETFDESAYQVCRLLGRDKFEPVIWVDSSRSSHLVFSRA